MVEQQRIEPADNGTSGKGGGRARKSSFLSEAWKRRLPLLPAFLIVVVLTQVPFFMSIYFSLTRWRANTAEPREFIGVDNYIDLVSNSFFWSAAWNSILMTVVSVGLSLLFGTGLALLLDRKFFGQGFARTLIITPFLVMPVVAGLVWKNQMLNSSFGVINWFIEGLGMEPISFASRYPLWTIVVVLVWQWTPFMMLIILAGLQGQSSSVLEAAKVDGANGVSTFFQITLPHLRSYLELGALLGVIYLSQVYDHIRVITRGTGSANLPYFVYLRSIGGGWQFGAASAYSIVVVIFSFIIANFGLRVLSGLLTDEGA